VIQKGTGQALLAEAMALLVVRRARMVTCGYHLLILSVQLWVRPGRKKQRKECSSEKGRDCSRSSFGGSSLGAWRPPVAEALIVSTYYVKEEKQ